MTPSAVVSRRGSDRLRTGHPWIFRSDILDASAEPGDLVRVVDERKRALGWAWFSSTSQITLRMVSSSSSQLPEDREFIAERVRQAAAYRDALQIEGTVWRLVHGESDGLPATIVDRYGTDDGEGVYFAVQTLSQGSDRRLDALIDVLVSSFHPRGIVVRNDPKVRLLEGLERQVIVAHGDVPERILVREGNVRHHVDLRGGQKTGLFLDQRENHAAAARLATGDALDAFSYNGGFALQMAQRASRVLAIDSSASAVAAIRANADANGLSNVETREANVFDELRELELAGTRFDTICLDPPAFAKNKAAVRQAVGGYKEINLRAIRLLRPGGHLLTCSCSYNIDEGMFRDVVRAACADARASVWVVETRGQARDHPVLMTVPETSYLKCLVLRRAS